MTHPKLIKALRRLSVAVSALPPVSADLWIYNPLDYAWPAVTHYHQVLLRRPCRTLFLGMNPGPFGMAQTGIPFGDVVFVRDWLQIEGQIGKPEPEHPKRPVAGFDCQRREVSGQRLWGFFKDNFGSPATFFAEHFVSNYCPLLFLNERGANVTPDKLPGSAMRELYEHCDEYLIELIRYADFQNLVGIGRFAESRLLKLQKEGRIDLVRRIHRILHPSPASPAANRGWAEQAARQLATAGIWAS